MCPIFLGVMSSVTLFYILQCVFSSYFVAGEYRYKHVILFQIKILKCGKFIKLSGQKCTIKQNKTVNMYFQQFREVFNN